jgi:hypothetical protein
MYHWRDWEKGLRLRIEPLVELRLDEQTSVPAGYIAASGGGSFDIAAALGVKPRASKKARVKQLSLATCYGLWAPQALREAIEYERIRVRDARIAILKNVSDANNRVGKDAVRGLFEAVLDYATKNQWRKPEYREKWGWEPNKAFQHFYDRLFDPQKGRLSPGSRERLSNPLFEGTVPDLFSSETEGEEFLDSFFESLEVESFKTRSQNRIWIAIRDFCQLVNPPYPAGTIRAEFEKALSEHVFEDECWTRADATGGTGQPPSDRDDDLDGDDE